MLEVVIPGVRHGEAVMDTSVAYNGCMAYISGINADGYQTLNMAVSSAQAKRSLYPVNKYYLGEDKNDTSDAVDKITKGNLVVYYEGGEYITDKFVFGSADGLGLSPTYWEGVETLDTSNWGRKTYVPGSSTAQATTGLAKLYVCTGDGNGLGYMSAITTAGGFQTNEKAAVAVVLGVYYEDSSHPFLRFRIAPGTETQWV